MSGNVFMSIGVFDLPLKKLRENAKLPEYAHDGYGNSGADVFALINGIPEEEFCLWDGCIETHGYGSSSTKVISLGSGGRCKIPLGFAAEIPEGYEIQIRPRSGLALKQGITVLNSPATIDASYRGELGVIIINHSGRGFLIEEHMKIAQLVLAPVYFAKYYWKDELSSTVRGTGGFGHTNK